MMRGFLNQSMEETFSFQIADDYRTEYFLRREPFVLSVIVSDMRSIGLDILPYGYCLHSPVSLEFLDIDCDVLSHDCPVLGGLCYAYIQSTWADTHFWRTAIEANNLQAIQLRLSMKLDSWFDLNLVHTLRPAVDNSSIDEEPL